jgi:hypothetical protein
MQSMLLRVSQMIVVLKRHLQRDPPQVTSFLHQMERSGYRLRFVNYDWDLVPTDPGTIVANPQGNWMLWMQR